MQELDELIAILEADIPANPISPKNQRLGDALKRDVQAYFDQIKEMIPARKVGEIYKRYVEE